MGLSHYLVYSGVAGSPASNHPSSESESGWLFSTGTIVPKLLPASLEAAGPFSCVPLQYKRSLGWARLLRFRLPYADREGPNLVAYIDQYARLAQRLVAPLEFFGY
jgi:hypothetical protein